MKEEFTLAKYFRDKNQKVVDGTGRSVRIIDWEKKDYDGKLDSKPVGAYITGEGGCEHFATYSVNGIFNIDGSKSKFDLYLVKEVPQLTKIEEFIANLLFNREYEGSTETDDDIEEGFYKYAVLAKEITPELVEIIKKYGYEDNLG